MSSSLIAGAFVDRHEIRRKNAFSWSLGQFCNHIAIVCVVEGKKGRVHVHPKQSRKRTGRGPCFQVSRVQPPFFLSLDHHFILFLLHFFLVRLQVFLQLYDDVSIID